MSRNLLSALAAVKYDNTRDSDYRPRMQNRPLPRETLAKNLRWLLDKHGWSERSLAKRSKVAQKTVNNILNEVSSPTLDKLEAIAAAFGLTSWQLIMPSLPKELLDSPCIPRILERYASLDDDGREYIDRTLDRETKIAGNRS